MTTIHEHVADFAYTVTGKWPFPADMLQHDQSGPATKKDADQIYALSGDHVPAAYHPRDVFTVDLVIRSAAPHQRPNAKRWESFDWKVVGDTSTAEREFISAHEERRMRERAAVMRMILNEFSITCQRPPRKDFAISEACTRLAIGLAGNDAAADELLKAIQQVKL